MKTFLKNHWKKIILIVAIFTIFMGRYQYKMPKRNYADFHAYYYTGERLLNGKSIYDIEAYREDKIANFKYPPICASIFALLALSPERTAATIWFTLGYALFVASLFYSGRMIFDEKISSRQRKWIYFWSLFFVSRFVMQNFDTGQVNFLMIFTLIIGIYMARKNRSFIGGLLIGFSILIKYMSAIFIPYFIFKRKYKLVFCIIASLVFFSLLPGLFVGWENNLQLQNQYAAHLSSTSLDFLSLSDEANQSIFSMLIRFFSTHGHFGINFLNFNDYFLGIISGGLCSLMYIISFVSSKNTQTGSFSNIDLSLLLTCAALFNPNAWMHAFIFLTFGYMAAFLYLVKNKISDKIVFTLLVISFILHSFTASFFTRSWAGETFEMYSFVTLGTLVFFVALVKIKFYPKT